MKATVVSRKGFYVGDPCYVLGDEIYYGVWGHDYEFQECVVKDPVTGMRFAVSGTLYGDGGYRGSDGKVFGVDSGTIAVVPLELVEKKDGIDLGGLYLGAGKAVFEENNGLFKVTLPSGDEVTINTGDEEEDEEDYDDCDYEVGYDPYLGCYTDDV